MTSKMYPSIGRILHARMNENRVSNEIEGGSPRFTRKWPILIRHFRAIGELYFVRLFERYFDSIAGILFGKL